MTIRDAIKTRIAALGLTQTELAIRSGVARQKINGYVHGSRLRSDNVEKLVKALGLKRLDWSTKAERVKT